MTETSTVRTVIRFLGWITTLLVLGAIILTREVIHAHPIDPAAVAVLGGITALAGSGVGAFGAMLVSTRSVNTDPEPDPPPADAGHVDITTVCIGLMLLIIVLALTGYLQRP